MLEDRGDLHDFDGEDPIEAANILEQLNKLTLNDNTTNNNKEEKESEESTLHSEIKNSLDPAHPVFKSTRLSTKV